MEIRDSPRNSAIENVESALLAHSTYPHRQSHRRSTISSDTTLVVSTSHQNTMSEANRSNSNGGVTVTRERYHSFGRGGAGNLRRPSDAMYIPSSQRVRDSASPPGDETRQRRRSSLFSAFSVGESEGGGRRSSSVWKHATDLWAKRRASTVEVEEVAVED